MRNKKEINYLYFLTALVYVTLLSVSHILSIQNESLPYKVFFSIYSVLQATLEVSLFILVGFFCKKLSIFLYRTYIGFLFLFLLAHFVDYILVKLMDTTILTTFKIFFASGTDHFFAAIQALNLNWKMAFLIIGCMVSIPIIGIFFYFITHKMTRKKPFSISFLQLGLIICAVLGCLFCLDIFARPYLSIELHAKYQKKLPLKGTFLNPVPETILLKADLKTPLTKEPISFPTLKEKPNIFLFIVETLRGDFICESISPNLHQLKQIGTSSKVSFANANASPQSWFSIFHSRFPYHWHAFKDLDSGSLPLTLLKNSGYQIKVYSSADLRYFHMNEMIFGKHLSLVDSFNDYTLEGNAPAKRDRCAVSDLVKDIKTHPEATVFIVFLDSTHSEYSWGTTFRPKFLPITNEIDYLKISQSRKGLEKIKNRYKNSIFYVDHLIGMVMNTLQKENLFENSILVVTGDHGEEFFEQGSLFHGTHLNYPQTNVPILYKFPKNPFCNQLLSSHVDIFPTLFHVLTGMHSLDLLFDGSSIFTNTNPFVLTVQQNGGETPKEFSLQNSEHKMIVRFKDPVNLYKSRELEIISLKTDKDLPVPFLEQERIKKTLVEGLEALLN